MRIRGVIQSIIVTELTAEADDAQSARALIDAQVPDGYELLQVHNAMPRGGRVIATGRIRPRATIEIEATGADYSTARATLLSQIPDDHRLLYVLTVE